jgi:hypothetical protein
MADKKMNLRRDNPSRDVLVELFEIMAGIMEGGLMQRKSFSALFSILRGRHNDEFDANGGGDIEDFAGRGQHAGGGIEIKDDDVAGTLIGDEEEFSRGVYADMARSFSAAGDALKKGKVPGCGVYAEHGDAVIAPIGAVEEFPGRMDGDFGGGAGAGEALGRPLGLKTIWRGPAPGLVAVNAGWLAVKVPWAASRR